MEGTNRAGNEQASDALTKQRKQELIEAVNKIKTSPEERFTKVYTYLRDTPDDSFTNWDIVCFCVLFLSQQIHTMPWLKGLVVQLSNLVYTQHYVMNEGNEK